MDSYTWYTFGEQALPQYIKHNYPLAWTVNKKSLQTAITAIHKLSACARRFELPTFWSVARRSIQLSYAHKMPEAGLEPARYRYRRILSPVRLPIPPLGLMIYINGPSGTRTLDRPVMSRLL